MPSIVATVEWRRARTDAARRCLLHVRRQSPARSVSLEGPLRARRRRRQREEARAVGVDEAVVLTNLVPLAREQLRGGRGSEHRVRRADPPLAARHLPRRRRVARVIDRGPDRVVARLAPVGQQRVVCIVGGHGRRQQDGLIVAIVLGAAWPVVRIAEARVEHHDTVALAARAGAVDDERAAREDGDRVVHGRPRRPCVLVKGEPVPNGDWHRRPRHQVTADKVAPVGAASLCRDGLLCEVDLVEDVRHAVHWIPERAVWVVQAAAVGIDEVEARRSSMRRGALLVARVARAVRACVGERGEHRPSSWRLGGCARSPVPRSASPTDVPSPLQM